MLKKPNRKTLGTVIPMYGILEGHALSGMDLQAAESREHWNLEYFRL